MLGFSLLEKEVTDKQERTTRINTVVVDQSWRHQCELIISLLLIQMVDTETIIVMVYTC